MLIKQIAPIKGVSRGFNFSDTPNEFSPDMNNVRPIDSLEQRIRLGQRPGLDKRYAQEIASGSPIVAICSVTTVYRAGGGAPGDGGGLLG